MVYLESFYGLSLEEAKKRIEIYGRNEIKESEKVSPIKIFASQFKSPIILLMIFASMISFYVNFIGGEEFIDSFLILIVILISAFAGFVQEYKAEKAIEALKKIAAPRARVIREGKIIEIESAEVVPDDLIVVDGGDIIPADATILEGSLEVDESPLTGESRSVKKREGDNIFSGCHVFVGKAIAKVFATGMKTEIGKIAKEMQEMKEEETPFQKELKRFTKTIVRLTILIIILTFLISFKKFGSLEAFLLSVSLAVAAIPESLPAVITATLALASHEMAKRNALIRRLAVTESIGSVDVICTDKTGTLTEGKMKVKDLWFLEESEKAKEIAIKICYYCNNANIAKINNKDVLIGDETDIALKEFSMERIKYEEYRKVDEIHFTSERKMMSVLCENENKRILFSKGAPEVILSKCSKALLGEAIVDLDEELKRKILEKNEEFASKTYRVLALAYKEQELEEKDLIFVALVLLTDPPRKEVKEAIEECYSAGIRVIMITGDNEATALAVAREIGLITNGAIRGNELEKMDEKDIIENLEKGVNVFARTNPFHKLKILDALKKKGYSVAMTGDGVNDALALKKADVGIAMGIKGTEVAKEASDIILLDDNFASIRNAIKEGRRIYDNMKKFIIYLFSCNIAEVFVVLLSLLFLPFILLYPIQILWINLVTDGLPALALSFEPAEPEIMKRRPRKKSEGFLDNKTITNIFSLGIVLGFAILLAGSLSKGEEEIRTIVFSGFVFFEIIRIITIKINDKTIGLKYWLENKLLLASIIFSIFLQFLILYSPFNVYFYSIPLTLKEFGILFFVGIFSIIMSISVSKVIDKIYKR
ncbi:MAG: calcium-translocating P-type ATPase, PMCA-type [Candidatus Aenigmatarchaeota archaeon]|nr:calcium-translocating P-type ATPase, PMCA-type [Candidatus Aenigmarchaeota archaeon]